MDFQNKYAVITGAASGIGKATAFKLVQNNCNVILLDTREDDLKKTAAELKRSGVNIRLYKGDISNSSELSKIFADIKKRFSRIDFLVNNAGVSAVVPFKDSTEEGIEKELSVNIKGTYLITKFAYPLMKTGGAIVNVSSVRGRTGTPLSSPGYAASKAAIINLTKTFAFQLAKYGIRVNAIAPGSIYPTDMTKQWNEEKRKNLIEKNVLHRLGTPEDCANGIYFLLSDLSSYITGHTLDINGGDWMN